MTEVSADTVVDGRYRIVNRIGSGGMADVYSAEDTHLGRQIALKVLHRRFAQDAEFVERFRREAKSAASLSHPNVVGIFDRGEFEGTYYIVMECLTGRTLKEVITQEAPLGQEHAIDLGIQVLTAAGFAHRRGVIHRDFKPHNVIVDDQGHAKVTDFGIARAGASEMTETGSIMGTAQYLSPEQAQGHAVTAASDLYSIGVMLYEMLAGRLPFDGDSAVSIALKHLNEAPVPISTLRPDIDPALESVVMAALSKDPAARWQSAEDFAEALEAARAHVLAGGSNGQNTAAWAAVAALPADDGGYPGEPEPEQPHKRRRWAWVALAVLILAMIGVTAFALTRPKMVDVPKVEGQQLEQARQILERSGFEKVKVERARSLAERDRVLDQDPDPGQQTEENGTITLEVSNGPGDTRVPSVENLPQERAVKELNKAGFKVNLDTEPSATVKDGFAVRTAPKEGTEVERGTRIRLLVSSGPARVQVPGVVGLLRESAESRLTGDGFDVTVRTEESDQPKDEVVSQTPSAGTSAERGASVTITVSTGPPPEEAEVSVPSVTGDSAAAAAAALRAAGFSVSAQERETEDESEDGKVISQSPAGGDAKRGSTVTIVVGKLKEPADDPGAGDENQGGGGSPP